MASKIIKFLAEQNFSIFNVDSKKAPVNGMGQRMSDWNSMSCDELKKNHNYSSLLWGMKMGEQENGKHILSLDFDVCGKKNEEGIRVGCNETKIKLDEFMNGVGNKLDGMFESSTEGNHNVLVDYSNSPTIKQMVKEIASNKFNCHELEILLGGNQVIPPSATTSKITGELGNPRKYKNENLFYIIEEENCFVYNFICKLMKNKLAPIKKLKNINMTTNSISLTEPETVTKTDDKYLDLIFNVIKNERNKDGTKIISQPYWFQICGIMKFNKYSKEKWLEYSKSISKTNTASKLWDSIKNTTPMSIYGLLNIAKEINPEGYQKWKETYLPKLFISLLELNSGYDTSKVISKTLLEELKYCKESWYVLNSNTQLWVKTKEATKRVLKEIRKYIDYSNKIVVLNISNTEGEEKEKLIKTSKDYLAFYKTIESSGYLSVLVKCLKDDLLDNKFDEKLDMNVGELAFKNGIVNLETKQFRKGIEWYDYLTDTIPYDYVKSDFAFVKSKLKEILNNNDEHLDYFLAIIGYSFIGNPELEKSIYFMIDKTDGGDGDNGKTFFFDILNDLAPNYVYKSKATLIEANNNKLHKQIALTKAKRLVWLEELSKGKQLNESLMKEIGDGKKMENEIMFGTSETIKILFKVFTLSNHDPKIDPNEKAVYNRYKQVSFNSHFDRTGNRTEPDPSNLKFIADTGLADKIKTEHVNEVFNLIIEYASRYYISKIPSIPLQFVKDTKQTQATNDDFGAWFEENCEICENSIIAEFFIATKSGMNAKMVREGMLRKGFKYDSQLKKGLGKDLYGKLYKGGYTGVKYIEPEIEEEEIEKV
jgi:phage/plasmid-associated DNA primase